MITKRIPLRNAACLAVIITSILVCISPNQTDTKHNFPIHLSLEQKGRYEADFSGEPIKALVDLKDSLYFSKLAWNVGKGLYKIPDVYMSRKSNHFEIMLYWRAMPTNRDSVRRAYYDSVFVSTGGNENISNCVRIYVVNLPVVLDSIVIGKTTFYGQDSIYNHRILDTASTITLKIFARDLDSKSPSIGWGGDLGRIKQSLQSPSWLHYTCPQEDFIDTFFVMIYDGSRGQVVRQVILSKLSPNNRPIIDSVSVGGIRISSNSGIYRYAFPVIDSFRLYVWAHDIDPRDTLTTSWTSKFTGRITKDPLNHMSASYKCNDPKCKDSLRQAAIVIDTITVTVFDKRQEFASKNLEIIRGTINYAPIIDSIAIGDTILSGKDTIFKAFVAGPLPLTLRIWKHDPDLLDRLATTWLSKVSTRFSNKTDSTAIYMSADTFVTDTIRIIVSDSKLTSEKKVVAVVNDLVPMFDSLNVDDSSFTSIDSIYNYIAPLRDTLQLQIYARDLDPKIDSTKVIYSTRDSSKFLARLLTRAAFVCPNSKQDDTISVTVLDGKGRFTKRVAVHTISHPPVIDSVKVSDTLFTSPDSIYTRNFKARTAIDLRIFASDKDKREQLTCTWSIRDTTRLRWSSKEQFLATYVSIDSTYSDTISTVVEDLSKTKARKKLILNIKK